MELIEVEVYGHADPFTRLDVLNGRMDPTYLEEIRGPGGGSVSISITDRKVLTKPSLLDYRNLLKIKVNGQVVGAFLVGKKTPKIIQTSADKEIIEVAGESLRTWFEDAGVRPNYGLTRGSYNERFFNFSSPQGSWYKPAQWVPATMIARYLDNPHQWGTAPKDWPDAPWAHWIWSAAGTKDLAPLGTVYFRREFTVPVKAKYSFFVAGDNDYVAYVDGQQTAVTDPTTYSWTDTTRIDIELDAGPHVFAAKVVNVGGPGGLIVATFKAGDANQPTSADLLNVTGDAGWLVCAYPETPPGWTPGDIMITLLNEAKARGVRFPNWLVPTFDALTDSYGQPWPRDMEFSFDIGTPFSAVVDKLEELMCDVWIDPDTLKLYAAPVRGADRTKRHMQWVNGVSTMVNPIVFEKGKNLLTAVIQGEGDVKNTLMIQTADGWVLAEDDIGSVGTYGRIEASLKTDVSEIVSASVAKAIFDQKAEPEEGASYVIVPFPGNVPFKDFQVGDWVLAPNSDGLSVKRRVMSISVTEDSNGQPTFSVEFDTIFRDNEDKMSRWMAKMGGGSLGGFANGGGSGSNFGNPLIPQPSSPAPTVPMAPTALSAASEGSWSSNGVSTISTVTLTWDAVTGNTDGSATIPRFYEVWAFPSGNPDSISQYAVVTTNVAVMRFVPNTLWTFKVRAANKLEYPSEFSTTLEHLMVGPTQPMLAPAAPVLSSNKGILNVTWDGLLGAAPTPPQFRYIYAMVSTSLNGTYTRMGTTLARDGRTLSITTLAVGTAYWVKLVAVDGAGISSPASSAATTTLTGINLGNLDSDVAAAIAAAKAAGDAANGVATNAAAAAAAAQTDADTAQTSADGKNKNWYQDASPGLTGNKVGDTWFDTNDGNRIYRWSGSAWVATQLGTNAIAGGAVTSTQLATTINNAISTATSTSTSAAEDAQEALDKVLGSITSSLDEYVVSNSSSVAPGTTAAWSPDTPDWTEGQYVWRRTKNTRLDGSITYSSPAVITGASGETGEDAVLLRVASSRGTSFKNSQISTVLTVTVFKGSLRITDIQELHAQFGVSSYLEWWWRRMNDAAFGVISSADNRLSQSGFALTVSPADVDEQSVFECRLQTSN